MSSRQTHPIGRAFAWVAARAPRSIAAAVLLAGLGLLGLSRPAPSRVVETGPDWQEAREARARFGGRDADVLALLDPTLGTADGADAEAAARDVERALEALPWVAEVATPWDLPGAAERPLVELLERAPEAVGAAVTPGRGMLLLVRRSGPVVGADGGPREPWDVALQGAAAAAIGDGGPEPVVTGLEALARAQERAFAGERLAFMVGGVLLGFLLASLSFRSVRATFLAGLPPIFGLVVSVGAARVLGLGSDGFTSIVLPLLVLTIGFTDSLHVVIEAARRRASSPDAGDAMRRAVGELGLPCALTSLTTAIGFGSMAVSGHAIIVDFGLSCAIATGLTFVCVLVSLPVLARTPLGAALEDIAARKAGGARRRRGLPAAVDAAVERALARPRATALAGAAATGALVLVFFGLDADRSASVDLSEGSDAARGLLRVDDELGGVFPVYVRVDWRDGVDAADALRVSAAARDVLASEPLVSGAVGPVGLARALAPGVDVSAAAAAAVLGALPGDARSAFVDLEGGGALVRARMPDAGAAASLEAIARLERELARLDRPDGVDVRVVGEHVAFLRSLQGVAHDLRWSLALAAALIVVTLSLAFRSLRLGAASVVPNLLPIGASVGGMAALGVPLDISALTALTLSLGIATDDTIHVLSRWVQARTKRPGGAPARAARGAVARTLPALALTTVALTAAFGQLIASSIPTIRTFGIVAATTLVVALLADVLVLPAILVALPGARRESAGT